MMFQMRQSVREKGRPPPLWSRASFFSALVVGVGYLAHSTVALAAEDAADLMEPRQYPAAQVFTFLFLMLGPFKIIDPFLKIVKGADLAFTRRIALRSTLLASLVLLIAAFLGETALSSYGISLPVLALSGGIILFLVALGHILREFVPPTPPHETTSEPVPTPTLNMALSPLAFPTIVTPYGIAALIVLLALSPNTNARLVIGAIVLAIMLLNLIVMLVARFMRPWVGALLQVLGAVLSVIQVALGLRIILLSFKAMGIL